MEVVDELFTPGCPNCAVKHLSSAIALHAMLRQKPESDLDREITEETPGVPFEARILVAQAYVNLAEVAEGYVSHVDFAIGLLNVAEEECVACGDATHAKAIRAERVGLILRRDPHEAMSGLRRFVSKVHEASAHQREAMRELPGFDWERVTAQYGACPVHEYLQHCISEIRKEFFDLPEEPEKGGETIMACGAKKKAVKAACKGGKCAAPAKKGGKKGCCK